MQTLPTLNESTLRALSTPESFARGQAYYLDDAISNTTIQGNLLAGECTGTSAPYYHVQVELDEAGVRSTRCTCPYDWGGLCKHLVALLLTYIHRPEQFAVRKEPGELLADLERDDLLALLTRLLREQPELYAWVEAALSAPTPASKPQKQPRKKVDTEVYRRQVRDIMHSLDRMRASESYWHMSGLTDELRTVQTTAEQFLDAGDPETALAILLVLADEAGHGIEYLDDSDGDLGDFVNGLGQSLAEAILSLELSAVEREKLLRELERLSHDLSDYGIEEGLALAMQAAVRGWDAEPTSELASSRRAVRRQAFGDEDEEEEEEWEEEGEEEDSPAWRADVFGDLTDAKLNVLKRQGRTEEYLALCQQAGRPLRYALMLCELGRVPEAVAYAIHHLETAQDALGLAQHLRESGHVVEAVSVGEHGLGLAGLKASLGEWLGPIEEAQGHTDLALQAWLAQFSERPTLATYQTLKRLAAAAWPKLQPQVMQTLRGSSDKMPLVQVLLAEQEWDAAIEVAEKSAVWYTVVETVADAVVEHRPEWVARVSIQHAERLMVEPKSKNYPLAAAWLKRAKGAYIKLGRSSEWSAYLQKVKEEYKRRPALQAQLRGL